MKKIAKILLGMPAMVVLMLLFATASGVATFVENDFGTESSWALVYASWWFALLQVWLGVSLIYIIFTYKLYKKEKIPSFIFHLSFLFILIGAGLTRYYGFEGILHIREGSSESKIISLDPYVQMKVFNDSKNITASKEKLFSNLNFAGVNNFHLKMKVDDEIASLKFVDLVPNATTTLEEDPNGETIISLNITYKNQPKEIYMRPGETFETPDLILVFSKRVDEEFDAIKPRIYIYEKDGSFFIRPSQEINWFKMSDNTKGVFSSNELFEKDRLYIHKDVSFAPKKLLLKGKERVVTAKEEFAFRPSALIAKLSYKNEEKEVILYGHGRGEKGYPSLASVGGKTFHLEWGSKTYTLPFAIELIEFQLERYPGSMSPSSYASEVKVVDKENGVELPYRIYMNNVLDYKGFRFFQSSYDKDELGTILSVNQDPGKWPTYLGYFLLALGLFLNILNPNSRFQKLARSANQDMIRRDLRNGVSALLFALLFAFSPQALKADEEYLSKIELLKKFDKDHANHFGKILVQSADGRIKPIDTISHDVLNKVYRGSSYHGLHPNQILLGMMASPPHWQVQPIIKIHHEELKNIIGVKKNATHASFNDFFDKDNSYKLAKYAEIANRKKPAQRNLFDKDVLKVDERLNVCYLVYTGEIFRMIPKINDSENTWYSPKVSLTQFPIEESKEVRGVLLDYFDSIAYGMENGDWQRANKAVDKIKSYQQQYGSSVVPQNSRVDMEIAFNEFSIFTKLTPVYLLAGFALLFAIFIKLALPRLNLNWIMKIVYFVNIFAFIAHTIGLGLRWYIAMHAPWSDSYESMVYIAWALALSGIIFSKRSPISLSLTAILAGITLFVAHLSWMDPQITTLVPVLKSHWLTIHVSVITASYGFLGLCSLLGIFTLILLILKNPKSNTYHSLEMEANIKEATKINEMAMILGLSLLIVGNFLGGVWANESWGRYWGWDAKETWTLVSVLVYSIIVHFRFIPKLQTAYAFAVASMFAYWVIIMTYFGVNFYLSGMHSYAQGDPVPIPTFVPGILIGMVVLSILAYFRQRGAKQILI